MQIGSAPRCTAGRGLVTAEEYPMGHRATLPGTLPKIEKQ
jgi:hypothetical protein